MELKSRVRHALLRIGLEGVVVHYRRLKGEPIDYLRGDRRTRFQTIYRNARWADGDANPESLSGRGSKLDATRGLRRELPGLLTELGAKSLLDVGCGDFNWMRTLDLPCPYIGVDIVPEVIDEDERRYGNERRRFLCVDAVSEALPTADVALCREVLFHLSLDDAHALLGNIRAAGVRYLLATTEPGVAFNTDIPTGAWREINLELKPYGLGKALRYLHDGDGYNPDRRLGVWTLSAGAGLSSDGAPPLSTSSL